MKKVMLIATILVASFAAKAQEKYRIETIYEKGVKVGYRAYYFKGKKKKGEWIGMSIHPMRTEAEAVERIEQEREHIRKFGNIEWILTEDGEITTRVNAQ